MVRFDILTFRLRSNCHITTVAINRNQPRKQFTHPLYSFEPTHHSVCQFLHFCLYWSGKPVAHYDRVTSSLNNTAIWLAVHHS